MKNLIFLIMMIVASTAFTCRAGIIPDNSTGKSPPTDQSIISQATPDLAIVDITTATAITSATDLVSLGEGGAVYSIIASENETNTTCLNTAITATTTSIPKKPETTKFTSEALCIGPGDYSWLGLAEPAQSLSENTMNSRAKLTTSREFYIDAPKGITGPGDSFRLGYAEHAQQSETLMNEQMTPNPEWGIGGHQIA